MSTENGAYRWWENYLVRYLMPSIAGAAIVSWLVASGHPDIKKLLLLELGSQGLQAPTLVLVRQFVLLHIVLSHPRLSRHTCRRFRARRLAPKSVGRICQHICACLFRASHEFG